MRRTVLHSFYYAWQGVVYCLKTQPNMRVHLLAAVCVCGLGWRLALPSSEMAILLLTIALVFVTEMLNTAVEKVVDLVSPQYHPLAKIAKDTAAGAVLVAALIASVVGYYLIIAKLV
jgi:diacylglycerol kinase